MKTGPKPKPMIDRLREKCTMDANGCLVFEGCLVSGYGQIRDGRTSRLAHRVMYEATRGPVPEGLDLDHLCRNRACCNPDHLEAVSRRENARRGIRGVLTTQCPFGHSYDPTNTHFTKVGHRQCRTCHRERVLAAYHHKRALIASSQHQSANTLVDVAIGTCAATAAASPPSAAATTLPGPTSAAA